jgi:hypothetical protein
MRPIARRVFSTFFLVALAGGSLAARTERRAEVDRIVDQVLAYVEQFHREMEGAVLEERYVQALKRPCCSEPRDPGENPALEWRAGALAGPAKGVVERRQLLSELLLVPVSGGLKVGYRDVFEVDGRPVRARDRRMHRLFEAGTAEGEIELGRINAESARFNIGPLRRNANTPSLPLLFLAPAMRDNLRFAIGGHVRRGDREVVVLEFREDGSPTLVSDAAGRDMPSRGRAWVDPESGAIREIELRVGERGRRVVRVWFRDEPRLGVLVPERMWEWYERIQMPEETWPVDLEGLATYTSVKLFTVETTETDGATVQ